MDTVSMLNKMSFYCQPILPLVYDESMSYYETLCKVVGQLNTTGDTVNKLNEGLTGEIADRQAADVALDERLKLIEDANAKIHFLVFVGANPNSAMPTRTELWNWVRDGDIICALYSANDTGRGDVYAASCTYNAGSWETENSSDFHFLIPLETTYDSTGKLAVKQKIVKLTIPSYTEHVLTVPWGKEIIEINTPHTSAEGIVNFSATVDNNNTVHANLSPAEFTSLYRAVSKGSGLIVGINAQLTTNDSQLLLSTTADIIGGETASDDEVRIVFDAETSTGERGLDLPYLTRVIYILAGSGTDETWTLTEFQTRDFAFDRDEGFQFTRAANNAITPSFGSTPKEVAEYFGTVKGGVPYQNLPVHLIDNVDNAEYWNGVFHRKSDGRIYYTFTTSYYRESKMLVRIIELSATPKSGSTFVGDEKWVYAEKEFELPFVGYDLITVTSTEVRSLGYDAEEGATKYTVFFDATFDSILANLAANKPMKFNITLPDNDGDIPISFNTGYVSALNNSMYLFTGTLAGAPIALSINALGAATIYIYGDYLPEPNPDDSDDGKVLAVNKHKWELKMPGAGDAITYVDFWPTGTGEEYNGNYNGYQIELATDQTFDAIFDSIKAGNTVVARLYDSAAKSDSPVHSVDATVSGDKELGTINFQFVSAGTGNVAGFSFIGETITLLKGSSGTTIFLAANKTVLPTPNSDGTDNGKVPIINGTKWELKTPTGGGASDFVINATLDDNYNCTVDKTYAQVQEAVQASKKPTVRLDLGGTTVTMTLVESGGFFGFAGSIMEMPPMSTQYVISIQSNNEIVFDMAYGLGLGHDETLRQVSMSEDPTSSMEIATKQYVDAHAGGGSGATLDTAMSDTSSNAVMNKVIKEYVDGRTDKVTLSGTIEGDIEGYTTSTHTEIVAELAKNCNIWLTIGGEAVRLASYKQSGDSTYILVFFGAGDGALTVKYEVTASVSSASLTVTGS